MQRIAHIVSPVLRKPPGDLAAAQPVTFETMRRASKEAESDAEVSLLCAMLPGERELLPQGFSATRDLDRSVLDIQSFRIPRALPLLKDILDRAYEATDGGYIVFTNADISLMPDFYTAVCRLIDEGYDAFVITRRSIPLTPNSIDDIPAMQQEKGAPHPGHDCFVFKRELYPSFELGNVCVGSSHVDLPLVCSMIAAATRFGAFTDRHLTFHLGNEQRWWNWRFRDYILYNDRAAAKALRTLATKHGLTSRFRLWYRALLLIPLLKNSLVIREWQRMIRLRKHQ